MKLETSYQNLDGIIAIVRKQVEEKWKSLGEAAAESAQFGAQTAQSYTATRPGATTGKAGRVETGDMIEALRPERVSVTTTEIHCRYGFIREYEEYFKYQTVTGFRHNRSGRYIGPTFALRDSIGPTREFARNAARRIP